jgi:putative ABC transport system permease protein
VNGLIQDLRFALRACARNPGFTTAALLSIAIGVGANSAIFSVASALLLRPLPYQDADRLAILWNRSPGLGIAEDWFSTAQYFDIRNGHRGFEEVAIAIGGNYNLTGDGEPERIGTVRVSSNLLPMLGARPLVGRLFTADDDAAGGAGVAVLNYGTWQRRYGGDRGAVGRSITLNGQRYQIAGVLAPFSLPREVMPTLGGAENAEVLLHLPLAADAATARNREDYNIIGKLKPGVGFAEARAEMDAITARLRREHPDFYPANGGLTFDIVPLQEQVVGDVRRSLVILIAAVGLVLLVACANVANLQLSRALARHREIAVRAALGASRPRIVRQLLTESVVLAVGGGALGLVFAMWSVEGIRALGSRSVPRLGEIAISGEVLLFTLAISIVSGVVFGLVPALRVCRVDLHDTLKDASRGSAGASSLWGAARRQNARQLLVIAELALSVMLLIGAGLLIRSFARLQQVPAGFNPSNLLTLELTMSGAKYNEAPAVLEAYRQLWERLERLPGVRSAGGVSALPLSQMFAWGPITVEGRPLAPGEAFINVDQRVVAGDYFQTMEIPLLNGRLFTERDTREQPRVVVIDDAMARQLWPDEESIAKRIRLGGIDATPSTPWVTVIGVVGRVKQYTLDGESRIAMYFPQTQVVGRAMNVVLRTDGDPTALSGAIRQEVRALDPDLPIYNVRTMAQRVDESLARRRFSMLLLTLFAALALGLATIGIYGVIAYLVAQGTRELGIRMALGATPRAILLLIVRHGLMVAVSGVGIGLIGALMLTRFMSSQLFGIAAVDPATFLTVALTLTLVALAASYLPARRAAAIDPMISLRSE